MLLADPSAPQRAPLGLPAGLELRQAARNARRAYPYEDIGQCWHKEPGRLPVNPYHHALGLNTMGRPACDGLGGGSTGTSARQGEACSGVSFIGVSNRKYRAMSTAECQEWKRKR
jgi:hypothetical protein